MSTPGLRIGSQRPSTDPVFFNLTVPEELKEARMKTLRFTKRRISGVIASRHLCMLAILLMAHQICTAQGAETPFPEKYNVTWTSQSKNSSESMPVNAGSIACNVWVEDGDLLFYAARSGSYDEHGALLKLGRVRLTLSPNPFVEAPFFRQELKLHDGFIELEGRKETGKGPFHVNIKVWVEVHRPVVHLDVDANQRRAIEYGVMGISTRLLFKEGKVDDHVRSVGACSACSRKGGILPSCVLPKATVEGSTIRGRRHSSQYNRNTVLASVQV